MTPVPLTRQEVACHIREAFRGVTLGNGVGLLEAQGIDDYADEATRKTQREQDEKYDWERIPIEALNQCHSSLSFFDAQGMRFHLPAFLIAELNKELLISAVYHLAQLNDYSKSQLITLNSAQRKAISEFLLLIQNEADYEFDSPHIERALSEYWIPVADSLPGS